MSRLTLILPTVLALLCVPSVPRAAAANTPVVARDAPLSDRPTRPALPADVETEEDDSRDERGSDDLVDTHDCSPHAAALSGVVITRAAAPSHTCGRLSCAAPRAPPLG